MADTIYTWLFTMVHSTHPSIQYHIGITNVIDNKDRTHTLTASVLDGFYSPHAIINEISNEIVEIL